MKRSKIKVTKKPAERSPPPLHRPKKTHVTQFLKVFSSNFTYKHS